MKKVLKEEYINAKRIYNQFKELMCSKYIIISDEEYNLLYDVVHQFKYFDSLDGKRSVNTATAEELENRIDTLQSNVDELNDVAYDNVDINAGIMDLSGIK